jgi:3-(methylthio)propanoyl-CoA dehydrogenase
MADYTAPIRDIRFTLEHVAGLDRLAALPGLDHVDPDTIAGALEENARFVSEMVAPTNAVGDRTGSRRNDDGSVVTPEGFKEAYEQFVAAGWAAVPFPAEHGGHGMPWVVGVALQEMLVSANMAFSLCPMLTQSAIEALIAHGSDEQRATYLPRLLTGEWSGTMDLTEPEAGSDVGALRARAVPAEDGTWRISGTKIFITWGEHDLAENIVHMVLARTPGAPPGTKGISLFIVPKFLVAPDGSLGERNDVHCVSIEHKLGIHASPTCVMSFGEGEGAVGYLVGEENRGMKYMFTMMNNARLAVGLEGLAVSERAYQAALAYAQERRQGRAVGAPATESSLIIEHPDVRRMLMTMKSTIEAMRGLVYANAVAIDVGHLHPDPAERDAGQALADLLTPVSKAWATDMGVELTSLGVQIHGGMGYVEETGVAQYFRDSRIAPIYEGTNGIQAIDLVMRKLPMEGGAVVRAYLDAVAALDADLAAAGDHLALLRAGLASGAASLREATEWLLAAKDPNDVLAGATPYLRMFGLVAGGYYLARGALAAAGAIAASGPDDYLEARIASARFFATQLVPQAAGLLPAVTAGAGQLFAVEPKHLGV